MQNLRNKKRRGFTLVEIIIVVVIIGILAALIVPRFSDATLKAKKTAAIAEHRTLVGEIVAIVAAATGDKLSATAIVDENYKDTTDPGKNPYTYKTKITASGDKIIKVETEIPGELEAGEQQKFKDASDKGGSDDSKTQKVTYIKVK